MGAGLTLEKCTALTLLALLCVGCATARSSEPDGAWLLAEARREGLELPDPLSLSDDAKKQIRDAVRTHGTEVERMRRLTSYLTGREGVDFQYSTNATSGAEAAFRARRGDCMAYSALVAAASRDLEVKSNFVYVSEVPIYYQHQGLFFVSSHIAVGVGEGAYQRVYDFVAEQTDWKLSFYQRISDADAVSLFFNNIAVEKMLEGKEEEAERLLSFLLPRTPLVKELYSNLGVVRMRMGRHKEALEVLELGISRYPSYRPLYTNAVLAARRVGNEPRAVELERAGMVVAGKDPYFLFGLGISAYQSGDFEGAAARFKDASAALPTSVVIWAWVARSHFAAEKNQQGREALRKLRELDPSSPLVTELEQQFSDPGRAP